MTIELPPSFLAASGQFHILIDELCPTYDDKAEFALRHMPLKARAELKSFLDYILNGAHSDEDIMDLWDRSSADVCFTKPEYVKAMLTAMQECLRRK